MISYINIRDYYLGVIEINKVGNAATIKTAVTDFASVMGYCEHQLPLIVNGVQVPTPEAAVHGAIAHKIEEIKEVERGELVPVTQDVLADVEAEIEFAREDVYTMLDVSLPTARGQAIVRLVGRIDKITRVGGALRVADDKFVSNASKYEQLNAPYETHMLQVLAYLNSRFYSTAACDEMIKIPHTTKEWILNIHDSSTRQIVKTFHQVQDGNMQAHLFSSIEHFASIALGYEEREHHNNPRKCAPCKYANVCEFFTSSNPTVKS